MLALGLATLSAPGAASLSVSPSSIWLSQSVEVTVGAIGWYDALSGDTNSVPSEHASGNWVFPLVTTSDDQRFDNLGSSSNSCTFNYSPTESGTNSVTAGTLVEKVVVVALTGITYLPNPVAVSSNVTIMVNIIPTDITPPSALEWSANVTDSGTSASQTWTNWGIYPVSVWASGLCGVGGVVDVAVFAIIDGWAESAALCCGATGGTNTFYVLLAPTVENMPSVRSNLVFWTGGPLTGTNTGSPFDITFTNTGFSIITATCGSTSYTFTNLLVRTEIDPSVKTNYLAYGGTKTVTLNLSSNAYGGACGIRVTSVSPSCPNTPGNLRSPPPAWTPVRAWIPQRFSS